MLLFPNCRHLPFFRSSDEKFDKFEFDKPTISKLTPNIRPDPVKEHRLKDEIFTQHDNEKQSIKVAESIISGKIEPSLR